MNGYLSNRIEIAPSAKRQLEKILTEHKVDVIKDFVKLSEDDVLAMKGITPYMKDKILQYLNENELRLGMTDDDIMEYQDEAYLQSHPEEKESLDADKAVRAAEARNDQFSRFAEMLKYELSLKQVPTDEEIVPISEEEPHISLERIVDDSESKKEECAAHQRILDELFLQEQEFYEPRGMVRPDDWEINFQCMVFHGFSRQPLYMKLFYSPEKRAHIAVQEAEVLLKALRKNTRERSKAVKPMREMLKSKIEKEKNILRELNQ